MDNELRDKIAMAAIPAAFANTFRDYDSDNLTEGARRGVFINIAADCYLFADAMLEARAMTHGELEEY